MQNISKKFAVTAMVLVATMLCAGVGIAADEKYDGPPISLTWSNYYPENSQIAVAALKPYLKHITEKTGGKIIFQEYWAGQLHGVKQGFSACKSGMTDITQGYIAVHSNRFDLFNVGEMPYAFKNPVVAAMVMEALYPKYFKKEYEKQGVYMASYPTINMGAGIISKKPVRKLEDLKGMKVLTGGGVISDSFKLLGVRPVAVAPSEMFSALQTGIIEAILFAKGMVIPRQFQEVAKYYTELNISTLGIPYCINRKKFDGLPAPLKKELYLALREANFIMTKNYLALDDEADKALRAAGVEIIKMPPEDITKTKALLEPIWKDFIEKKEAKGLPAKQMVEDLRKLSQKYGAMSMDELQQEVRTNPVKGIINGL